MVPPIRLKHGYSAMRNSKTVTHSTTEHDSIWFKIGLSCSVRGLIVELRFRMAQDHCCCFVWRVRPCEWKLVSSKQDCKPDDLAQLLSGDPGQTESKHTLCPSVVCLLHDHHLGWLSLVTLVALVTLIVTDTDIVSDRAWLHLHELYCCLTCRAVRPPCLKFTA